MSFERDSVFSDEIDSKKPRTGSSKQKPPKKEAEGLDDLFGGSSSKKDKNDRLPVKTW